MAIDSRFIVTSDLESLFRDKDSGEPLAGGIITFYSDLNRSTKKPVYQITGSPPNYTYAALPNPSVLSDVGTFQDALGNNIVPYYFPYEDTPDDGSTTVELYYITVTDADGVAQFTREGWPNFAGDGSSTSTGDDHNFIPNGQFLAHTDIVTTSEPPVETIAFGAVNLSSQSIAQGGWSFRRSDGGTSVFANTFERIAGAGVGLNDFPRFAFNFVCTSFNATDTVRDLTISWPNVEVFSGGSPVGTQEYTFYFSATSNDVNTYVFSVYLIQYFGTGGSPSSPIQTLLTTVSVGAGYTSHTIHISGFPANAGTLGTNDDDYVAIAIRGPASSWNAQFTDFALLFGNVSPTSFPVQTNAQQLSEGVTGWMPTPNPDGSDLYLPLVLTTAGVTFDDSEIGSIVADMSFRSTSVTDIPMLYCNGAQYAADSYSSLGIPYRRLWNKLTMGSPNHAPLFGTGANFVNASINTGATDQLVINTNKTGLQTDPVDGAIATGFTFPASSASGVPGSATIGYKAYSNSGGYFTAVSTFTAATNGSASVAAGTSGITFTSLKSAGLGNQYYAFYGIALSAAALGNGAGAGKYFTFSSNTTNYYVWFKTATESDPAPGGTGIKVSLPLTMVASDTASVIANAISAFQVNTITTVAAAAITQSSYFTFTANSVATIVWYNKAGGGTAPAGSSLISVALGGSETAAEVATATVLAINRVYFAVPDLRGVFLRGSDSTGIWDVNMALRGLTVQGASSAAPGTLQIDQFGEHTHTTAVPGSNSVASPTTPYNSFSGSPNSVAVNGNITITSSTSGTFETIPVNKYVQYYIKY